MKRLFNIFLGVGIILLLYMIIRFVYAGGTFLTNRVNFQPKSTWDSTLACQEIASQSTNKDWEYKNCLQELMNTIPEKARLL